MTKSVNTKGGRVEIKWNGPGGGGGVDIKWDDPFSVQTVSVAVNEFRRHKKNVSDRMSQRGEIA